MNHAKLCMAVFSAALVCMNAVSDDGGMTRMMFGHADVPEASREIAGFRMATPDDLRITSGPGQRDGAYPWFYVPNRSDRRPGAIHGSEPADRMLEHGIEFHDSTLTLPAPDGKHILKLWVGDWFTGIRRFSWRKEAIVVKINGDKVLDIRLTPETVFRDYWCRGADYLFSRDDDPWDRLVKPILDEYEFEVEASGGGIELEMDGVLLSALALARSADEMEKASAELEAERRADFAKRYPWKPQPDEPMPEADPASTERGFLFFQKYGDDAVHPWTRPAAGELSETVRVFAARGEQEIMRFGILPLRELRDFEIKPGDFESAAGDKIPLSGNADFWRERYKERGSETTSGQIPNIRRLDPESYVLQKTRALTYEPGTPRMFTLDVHVPESQAAGDYFAPVTFLEEGKPVGTARLQLKVLPFDLLYEGAADYNFQNGFLEFGASTKTATPEFLKKQITDRVEFIAKYKFSSSYQTLWGWRFPSIVRIGHVEGEIGERNFRQTPEQAATAEWWFRFLKKEGNTDFVMLKPGYLFSHLGISHGKGKYGCGYGDADDSPETLALKRKDTVRVIKQITEYGRRDDFPEFRWYNVGELDNYGINGVLEAIEYNKIIEEAGGISLMTINGPLAAKHCPPHYDYLGANFATPITQELIDAVESHGHKFASHNTGDKRFQAGWHFWRMGGAFKHQETTFYTSYLLPFVYLPWNYNTAHVYPARDGTYRPILNFYNYRDGRDDYLYLHTLEQLMAKAAAAGKSDSAAYRKAGDFLSGMRDRIHLDARMYQIAPTDPKEATLAINLREWNSMSFERYRWHIATLIMDIRKELEEI